MRFTKTIAVLGGLSWLVRLERRTRLQQSEAVRLHSEIERKISEHRVHSPHGIALIGHTPSLEPDAQQLFEGGTLSSEQPLSPYFGLPVHVIGSDPEAFIRGADLT